MYWTPVSWGPCSKGWAYTLNYVTIMQHAHDYKFVHQPERAKLTVNAASDSKLFCVISPRSTSVSKLLWLISSFWSKHKIKMKRIQNIFLGVERSQEKNVPEELQPVIRFQSKVFFLRDNCIVIPKGLLHFREQGLKNCSQKSWL